MGTFQGGRSEGPNPPRLLEPEEITRLLEEPPDQLRALVGVVVYAGLRADGGLSPEMGGCQPEGRGT